MYGHMNRHNKTDEVAAAPPLASKRLLNQVRERIRHLHYSLKTEKADLYWVRFFLAARRQIQTHPVRPLWTFDSDASSGSNAIPQLSSDAII